MRTRFLAFFTILILGIACEEKSNVALNPDPVLVPDRPSFYQAFRSGYVDVVQLPLDRDYIYLKSNGEPDHCSVYFCLGEQDPRNPCDDRWCTPPSPPWMPTEDDTIETQEFVFRVPIKPTVHANSVRGVALATAPVCLPIGIAVNGVALFNHENVEGGDAADESVTFDTFRGHPANGIYHYHLDPIYITDPTAPGGDPGADPAALVGVMLDGIPLYGPEEPDGSEPVLDTFFHGHYGPTPEDPSGNTWHYHVTDEHPYFVGKYKGTVLGTCENRGEHLSPPAECE